MSRLSLSLLGPFQVALDGRAVTSFESAKVRALLAYLAVVADRPHPREVLAGLLWPDWPNASALSNLRYALSDLRQVLGDREATPPFLLIAREALQFNTASDYELDVRAFESALADKADLPALERAAELYRGRFLEGFSVSESAPFEGWMVRKREELERQALAALRHLGASYERRGEYGRAEAHARRQVELAPEDEVGHQQLMRALALGGQRSAALGQYEACRRLLAVELGVEPGRETTALYERIREGLLAAPSTTPVGLSHIPPFPGAERQVVDVERPPVVARERELARLEGDLELALGGQGRVAFVTGDPGTGKSTLVGEFVRRAMVAHSDLIVAQGNGNAYTGVGDPYLPFLEVLQMLSGDVEARWAGGGIAREHAQRLWALVPEAVQALVEHGPELIDLFVPGAALLARGRAFAPDGAPWLARLEQLLERKAGGPGSVAMQQAELFGHYTRVVQALARQHPLILVLDDLQWADAGSIALLFHLGRKLSGQRILIVGAYRTEEVALGRDGERHPLEPVVSEFQRTWGEITIDLAQAEGQRLVVELLDQEPNRLDAAFRETLYRHTGGQALFTVELLRGLKERGDLRRDEQGLWVEGPGLNWERLPARVEAVIGEGIKRLPEEDQALLAVASVEGEEFTAEAAARVRGLDEREAVERLSGALSQEHRLVLPVSLRRLGEQRLSRYRFRHYLFQSYLYQRLDEVQRVRLHEEVGVALEALHGARPQSPFEDYLQDATGTWETLLATYRAEAMAIAPQLARHFQAAGLTAKAVAYLQQAGGRAWSFAAYQEACAHLNRALELLSTTLDTPERARAEYFVQDVLNDALRGLRGPGAPERGPAVVRAYELAQRLGAPFLAGALLDLYYFRLNQGDVCLAMGLAQQLTDLAEREFPRFLPQAHFCLALDLYWRGDFRAARERLVALLSPGAPPFLFSEEPPARAILAFALWYLGYPDQALRLSQRNLSLAYKTEDPALIALVLSNKAAVHQLRRDVHATLEGAEQLLSLTGEERWPWLRARGVVLAGWAHAQEGRVVDGIATMRQGLAALRETGEELRRPHSLALLAEGYALAGQPEEGLGAIAEALEHVERTGERYYEAELHRLKGELLLQRGKSGAEAEAEACFQKAIEVARRQEARSWELRATMSLCRLWQSQGNRQEAREALAAIYGWFTEGFDTPDLQEAKALLEELSAGGEQSTRRE